MKHFCLILTTAQMDSNSKLEYELDSDSDSEYDLEYSESLLSENEEPPESSSQLLTSKLPPSKPPPSELPPSKLSPSEPLPSEPPSSGTSTLYERHSIGARIQAITFLELGIPHWEIKAKTKISKS
jgi:hypothetical protein